MTRPNRVRGRSAEEWTAAEDERLRALLVKGMSAREIGIELNCTAGGSGPISRLSPEPPGTEARSFANWDMGKKARAEEKQ
jgi:hypothetical protein